MSYKCTLRMIGIDLFVCVALLIGSKVYCQPNGDLYTQALKLHSFAERNISYNPLIRPLWDQSKPLIISLQMALISIINVDDRSQSISINGLLYCVWRDELLGWNPEEYGMIKDILLNDHEIWTPEIVLMNSLDANGILQSSDSQINILASGYVTRALLGIFTTSCLLDLTKYPYDVQTCTFKFAPLKYNLYKLQFQYWNVSGVERVIYQPSSAWELLNLTTNISNVRRNEYDVPKASLVFSLKRRPESFMLTVLLPAMALSFMNNLVFIIPADSGEKISYGITVLLSQYVLITIVSGMLPQTSVSVPLVTIYIFVVLMLAMFSLLISIVVVALSGLGNRDKNITEKCLVCSECNQKIGKDCSLSDNTISTQAIGTVTGMMNYLKTRNWKEISRRLNVGAFVTSFLAWITVTLYFIVNVVL